MIAPLLGDLLRFEDPEKESRIAKCLRIRVWINLKNPLKKGFFLKRQNAEDLWIKFQYERLSDFCLGCGLLDHVVPECKEFRNVDRSKWNYDGNIRAIISFLRTINFGVKPPEAHEYPGEKLGENGGASGLKSSRALTPSKTLQREEVEEHVPEGSQQGRDRWQEWRESYERGMCPLILEKSCKPFDSSSLVGEKMAIITHSSGSKSLGGENSYLVEEPDSPLSAQNSSTNFNLWGSALIGPKELGPEAQIAINKSGFLKT